MRRLLFAAAGFLTLAAGASSSSAADLPVKAPGPAPAAVIQPTWNGFYAGVSGGWVDAKTRWTQGVVTSPEFSDSGWLGGATLGANWQAGIWVLGVEGDISAVEAGPRFSLCAPSACSTDLDWLGTARLRAGVSLTPSWLLYGTGGLAVGGIHHFVTGLVSTRETKAGWTAGLGTEWMMLPNWSLKAEYLYVDFGETAVCSAAVCGVAAQSDFLRAHIVRAGLNYHF